MKYDPDPRHFEEFCCDVAPHMLEKACGVSGALSVKVGQDMAARAEAYAALSDRARDVLRSPFVEEVFGYKPAEASLVLKADVCVVVRSSLLEEAHSHGPVNAGGIEAITTAAAAPLSHFLAARRREPAPVNENMFARLEADWPRAWACLDAVARSYGSGGGRWPYHVSAAPVPKLPVAEVRAPASEDYDKTVVLSGIDPRFDEALVRDMCWVAEPGDSAWVGASLSRVSRHLGKIMQFMEYLLAHESSVLTANYLLRPGEVWVRGRLVAVDRDDPVAAWRDLRGLSGVHRKVAVRAAKQLT